MGLLDDGASPPASAYCKEPLTVAEIDAHPDRDRIWATIMAMRDEAKVLCDEANMDGYRAGQRDG